MKNYRVNHPDYDKRQYKITKARNEARRRLAEMYPEEYERIFNEIKRREELL